MCEKKEKGVLANMRNLNKIDILIFAALFVALICLITTGVMQVQINKNLKAIVNGAVTDEDEKTFTAQSSEFFQSENSYYTSITETQDVTEAITCDNEISTENEYNSNAQNYFYSSEQENTTYEQTTGQVTSFWQYNQTKPYNIQSTTELTEKEPQLDTVFVFSKNSKKLHSRTCPYVNQIKEENKRTITSNQLQEYLDNGYTFCSHCQGYVAEE